MASAFMPQSPLELDLNFPKSQFNPNRSKVGALEGAHNFRATLINRVLISSFRFVIRNNLARRAKIRKTN